MYVNCMKSLRAGVVNCSSQIDGCTPVSQIIERDELRVLPASATQMNEVREFLEAKQKEKMRVPVPPEMPELLRERC